MKASTKIIYFDNGCRVCRVGAKVAGAVNLNNGKLTPLQEMDANSACNIDKSRYCNEIAVYDSNTHETRYGVKGLLWVLEDRFGKIMRLFTLPIIFHLINFFYHIFSYNRRMIAPVYKKVDGDCEPEFHWGYRLGYIFLALFCIALFGIENYGNVILLMPNLITGLILLALNPKGYRMEVLGHIVTLSLIQLTLLFLVCPLLNFIAPMVFISMYLLIFVIISLTAILSLFFYKRMKYLKLNFLSPYYILTMIIVHLLFVVVIFYL